MGSKNSRTLALSDDAVILTRTHAEVLLEILRSRASRAPHERDVRDALAEQVSA
ncbi:hypothetical protein H9L10_03700 [Phycicoccus endophyticus]|uniref:Uncharacterized protein n=1 Tax=Phycicoccus endophyticus TaxID=1690220 RepID=A0A7G9R3J8_9MICO|nr:hypothetical protein [Phycicoccus endophyticus]NHI19930.1 hypothetical protein [Phycicoccus endophyticus]QNN50173.1 hypothetical protein H9L10_03700 [Phycicoccus endophyticus]GGL27458.1 hypothetical protein GCM10012283_07030 [Phycicoccus endophyticus]